MAALTALSPDGRGLAVAHDAQVWLSEREPGAPAVVLDLPDPAVSLAMSHDRVFAVTEGGVLVMANRRGRLELRRRLGGRGVAVGGYGDHVVAFTTEGWLRWRIDDAQPDARWGKERTTALPDLQSGACAGDGRVAALNQNGDLFVYDARDRRRRRISLGGDLVVRGGPAGWFVARVDEVVQVTPGGRVRPVLQADVPIRALTASPDGRLLAVPLGDEIVALWSVSEGRPLSRVQVFGRRVSGVTLGVEARLGVGLDHGDGHWLDLDTEQFARTQPPLGDVRRTWAVSLSSGDSTAFPRGVGPDDATVEASRVLRRLPSEPEWPALAGFVALGVFGIVTGWMMGQAALP
ncbi:MAG: hypothetical protein AAF211_22450 [Myxococcota bacterium]